LGTMRYRWLFVVMLGLPCAIWAQGFAVSKGSLDSAISRAVTYFQNQPEALSNNLYPLYHFLHRKFGVALPMPADTFLAHMKADPEQFQSLQPYLRILQKTAFRRSFLVAQGSTGDITVAGIWYDKLRPSKELERRIAAMDFTDDYQLTHAYLAICIARQVFRAQVDAGLADRVLDRMLELAQPQGRFADVNMEAVALLHFGDDAHLLTQPAIGPILAQQTGNGLWEDAAGEGQREPVHTTVLALWALLEYRHPEAGNVSFIVR
jgi:hypothetical protein